MCCQFCPLSSGTDMTQATHTHILCLTLLPPVFPSPLSQNQLGDAWWHQAKLHSLYKLTSHHNIGHLYSKHVVRPGKERPYRKKLAMLRSFKKTPSRAAHFLQPTDRNQCLPPAQKLSDFFFLDKLEEKVFYVLCTLFRVSLWRSCVQPFQMSHSPFCCQNLQVISPFRAHGKCVGLVHVCPTRAGQLASCSHILHLHQISLQGEKQATRVRDLWARDMLQGLCRWSWSSPQQRFCLKVHPAGRRDTKKIFISNSQSSDMVCDV